MKWELYRDHNKRYGIRCSVMDEKGNGFHIVSMLEIPAKDLVRFAEEIPHFVKKEDL